MGTSIENMKAIELKRGQNLFEALQNVCEFTALESDMDEIVKSVEQDNKELLVNDHSKSGVDLIAQERKEQIDKHGRTVEQDVELNKYGQLRNASIMLLEGYVNQEEYNGTPFKWDSALWEKMYKKPYKDRLVTAGALIAAEVDRLSEEEKNAE